MVLSFSSSFLHLPSAEIIGVSLLVCVVPGTKLGGVDARHTLSHLNHSLSPADDFLFTVFVFPSAVQVVAMCSEMASLLG